jgi:hypothetical protein
MCNDLFLHLQRLTELESLPYTILSGCDLELIRRWIYSQKPCPKNIRPITKASNNPAIILLPQPSTRQIMSRIYMHVRKEAQMRKSAGPDSEAEDVLGALLCWS